MDTTPPAWTKFAVAGSGGAFGWLFIHPIDVVKVRCQINTGAPLSPFRMVSHIAKSEGARGLYAGLSAALARQLTYGTMRIGMFEWLRDATYQGPVDDMGVAHKLAIGLVSGAVAAVSCCPVEVSLVRMQADSAAPVGQRRGYKHIFDALWRINREESASALFRGLAPTVQRAMVVNMVQVVSYDQAKTVFRKRLGFQDGVGLHLAAAVTAGFTYSIASLPLDIAKTRMQNQHPCPETGRLPYSSLTNCLTTIARTEGLRSLWKGFTPYFARCGGHTVTLFLTCEQLRNLVKRHYSPAPAKMMA